MGTTSQYVLDRRENPSLMDEKDLERLVKAEEKRKKKQEKRAVRN